MSPFFAGEAKTEFWCNFVNSVCDYDYDYDARRSTTAGTTAVVAAAAAAAALARMRGHHAMQHEHKFNKIDRC